jgi:hypothetical protein
MKKVSKTTIIFLCLALVLTIGALAAWDQYQGNANHNGRIDAATCTPPIATPIAVTNPPLNSSGNGWSGVDTEPVMETVTTATGDVTYAYVTYNGRSEGTQISKINCNTGATVWSTQLGSTSGNQLSTPYLDTTNGKIYVAATDYYWLLDNNEFTSDPGGWTLPSTGATITVGTTPDTSYITINAGKSISQSFTYSASGNARTQLTSAVKLVPTATTNATITYTLSRPGNLSDVQLHQETLDHTKTDAFSWNYIEKLGTNHVGTTGTYTITVSVTGADVIIDYVTYSRQTSGIKVVDTNGNIVESNLASSTYGGQINTPITVYGDYLYYGTYSGMYYYYQVYIGPTANGRTHGQIAELRGKNHFYWAGAIRVQDEGVNYIVFGGDGGYLYWRLENSFAGSLVSESTTDGSNSVYDLSVLGGVTAGNVRSSISRDDDYLYFTSQGDANYSYIWRFPVDKVGCTVTSADIKKVTLTGKSTTSTPAISSNGRIYVGYYGSTGGGVDLINSTFTGKTPIIDMGTASVQSSIIVYTPANSTTDYIYFTTNAAAGEGYCYSYTSGKTASSVYATT